MGFLSKITAPGAPYQAEIYIEGTGPWAQSFVDSVKQCIAQRAINLQVNVTKDPSSLKEVMEPLLKLQQFVASKGGKVILVGAPAEGLEALKAAGIQVEVAPPQPAPISAAPVAAAIPTAPSAVPAAPPVAVPAASTAPVPFDMTELETLLKKAEGGLLPANEVVPLAQSTKVVLEGLLKEIEKRGQEHQDFTAFLKHLAKHQTVDVSKVKELSEVATKESDIGRQREQIPSLKKQMVEAKTLLETEEKASKEFIQKSDAESKKKLETFKKELDTVKSNHKKLEADFQKRIDTKKAEIGKIEAQKAAKT
ncbi:MAG: hypothetical protein AB7F59_07800 [Bdellovibrionales bacterium]